MKLKLNAYSDISIYFHRLSKLFLLIAFLVLTATACQNNKTVVQPAFYFWQTHLNAGNFPIDFVKQQNIKKLYICLLNIEANAQNQAVPSVETTVDWSVLPSDMGIVPVVYIPNRVFERIDTAEIKRFSVNLSRFFKEKLPPSVSSRFQEVQLDCDWTEKTRAGYFMFLKQFKQQIQLPLSATIRLHQVKYRHKTGVPPVDHGALMVYNLTAPNKFSDKSSIFDAEEAGKYLKGAKTYELPLDMAFPLFSWGLVFRNREYKGIFSGLNSEECRALTFLIPPTNSQKKYFEVNTDTVFKGIYLRNGDEIEIEEVSEKDLLDAAKLAAPLLNSDTTNAIFYHLNSFILKNYNADVFQKVANRLH
jgi:hypothetical protein